MARHPRFALPGYTQHVIQRGNNRDIIFVDQDDYSYYRERLIQACDRFGCAIHAYVFMTNHVHLLMTPQTTTAISQVMQALGRVYVQYFNHRYHRTGTLWEGRFRASVIDADHYLLICHRYIELNPVRAGMVGRPEHYPWSSYGHNAQGRTDDLLTPHPLYQSLGTSVDARCAAYRTLFADALSPDTLDTIRESTNKAWVMGHDRFRDRIEAMLERQSAPKRRGGDRKSVRFRNGDRIDRV
jgi:putative transposase